MLDGLDPILFLFGGAASILLMATAIAVLRRREHVSVFEDLTSGDERIAFLFQAD